MNEINNPLLLESDLPRFSKIQPKDIEPAIDHLLNRNRSQIEALSQSDDAPGRDNFLAPLSKLDERLVNAWSPVSHLNAVADSPDLRKAYNAAREELARYGTEMGQNHALFERYRSLRQNDSFEELTQAEQRAVDLALRDFRLSGVALDGQPKERFAAVMQRLSQLSARFAENVLDATDGWSEHIQEQQRLSGIPDQAVAAARAAAETANKEGWLITLDMPSFHAVMTHADDRALRRSVYEAYVTRASDQGPHAGRWDNSEVMSEILALRHEAAELVGFESWAEYSLSTKMAESPEQVESFLRDLAARSRPAAEREYEELVTFARERLDLAPLKPWDIQWASEKLRVARYDLSDNELRPYFPLPGVLDGMLDIAGRLFAVQFACREDVDVWHPSVSYYDVLDETGAVVAGFYLDPTARPGKRSGAWMDVCRNRSDDGIPVAYLTCNFSAAADDEVALLTHSEVSTLFHEFGHGLHLMLTRVPFPPVGGLNAVEWDAVELPSQLMENWTWEKQALDLFARHFESEDPMPESLFQRLTRTRTFQAAMRLTRQLEFALFDLRLHAKFDPEKGARVMSTLNAVREEVALYDVPDWNRFAHGFSHIFGGGYAAGYYSYLWAEVMAQDAFSAFEESGVFDSNTGQRFRDEVLAVGATRPAAESFRAFRGRDAEIGALLKSYGLS